MRHVAFPEGKNNPFTIVKGKGDKNSHIIMKSSTLLYMSLGNHHTKEFCTLLPK